MKLRVITTGGTIDKIYFDKKNDFEVGEPQIGEVYQEAAVSFSCEIQSVLKKDSLDLTDEDRALIRRAVEKAPESRILITHGTDTMIKTALSLEGIVGKTVVLVGSLAPARFRNSDAIFNIGFATGVTMTLPPGIYIAMNGRVFDPKRTGKNAELNRFEEI